MKITIGELRGLIGGVVREMTEASAAKPANVKCVWGKLTKRGSTESVHVTFSFDLAGVGHLFEGDLVWSADDQAPDETATTGDLVDLKFDGVPVEGDGWRSLDDEQNAAYDAMVEFEEEFNDCLRGRIADFRQGVEFVDRLDKRSPAEQAKWDRMMHGPR